MPEKKGGPPMKVNLTKLLEKAYKEKADSNQIGRTSASYFLKTDYDVTSSERAYSFELEKETFRLKK
jgi:hypothetical protein